MIVSRLYAPKIQYQRKFHIEYINMNVISGHFVPQINSTHRMSLLYRCVDYWVLLVHQTTGTRVTSEHCSRSIEVAKVTAQLLRAQNTRRRHLCVVQFDYIF